MTQKNNCKDVDAHVICFCWRTPIVQISARALIPSISVRTLQITDVKLTGTHVFDFFLYFAAGDTCRRVVVVGDIAKNMVKL